MPQNSLHGDRAPCIDALTRLGDGLNRHTERLTMTTAKTAKKITAAQIRELASQPDAHRAIISQCFMALGGCKRARRVCAEMYERMIERQTKSSSNLSDN